MTSSDWLEIRRGPAPLLVSLPHTGTDLPDALERRLRSPWLGRKDTDWWIDRLYGFAGDLGATVVRTAISRTAIDVNRDPTGASLYPGLATTELCPTTTFDGEPLYGDGELLDPDEIAERRAAWFDPFHAALDGELERLRSAHGHVVVYDCHSIRSRVPRLFEGRLPVFNIGTNDGSTCAPALQEQMAGLCRSSGRSWVANGRFKGGFITRRLGRPADGVHAVQMELACRGYLREPEGPVGKAEWPPAFDADFAAPIRNILEAVLRTCLDFARRCD